MGLAANLISGCKKELPEILYEDAVVVKKEHKEFVNHVTPLPDEPERYLITFDGRINFVVDSKNLYDELKIGDTVIISYKEKNFFNEPLMGNKYKTIDAKLKDK